MLAKFVPSALEFRLHQSARHSCGTSRRSNPPTSHWRHVEHTLNSFKVLGIPVSEVDLASASAAIVSWAKDKDGRYVCVRDVHGVVLATSDTGFTEIHKKAAMVTPDGKPLALIGRMRGLNVGQTTGSDLFEEVVRTGRESGVKHFLYGGKPGVAEQLVDVLSKRFPGARIVGVHTPPFRPLSDIEVDEVRAEIIASEADVVWVGLSTPKQEHWMSNNVDYLPCTLIGVGAAFDFHTGAIKRAPRIFQILMLEWLYRMMSEPKRLMRRYLHVVPRFIYLLGADWIKSLRAK